MGGGGGLDTLNLPDMQKYRIVSVFNPCPSQLFRTIFRHLDLELLTQFPAPNGEK